MSLINIMLVFLGGGLGSICRYAITHVMRGFSTTFPMGTILANIVSCLILGALIGVQLKNGLSSGRALLLMTGFCGGFSTFSTFTGENYKLLEAGEYLTLTTYIIASLVVCIISLFVGVKMVS